MYQYVSDLHLEFQKPHEQKKVLDLVKPIAPYLLLAGDIAPPSCGHLGPFLQKLSQEFKHVFLIPGNHEYQTRQIYMKPEPYMSEIDNKLRTLCNSQPNITFLQNECYHFPDSDVSLFGATFWTPIDPKDKYIREVIRDYSAIPGFTPEVSTKLWTKSVQTLQEVLQTQPERKWIVMSHHIPKMDLIHPLQKDSPGNEAFASNIPCADHPSINAWVYGHTHTGSQVGHFYCNPYGYPGENRPSLLTDHVFSLKE